MLPAATLAVLPRPGHPLAPYVYDGETVHVSHADRDRPAWVALLGQSPHGETRYVLATALRPLPPSEEAQPTMGRGPRPAPRRHRP